MNPSIERALELYELPFMELLYQAHEVHRKNHDPLNVQKCTLLSIKTGGCSEDCSYCPQSAHYDTGLEREPLLPLQQVKIAAQNAKANGAERFCMGAAWRNVRDGAEFDRILEMVKAVKKEGLEACVTLGMLNEEQAKKLKDAGLDAYNHNLDSSSEFYQKIIHTRTYEDRLNTLKNVRKAGLSMCSGGIIGMGETSRDRCEMLTTLASFDPQPESVPINLLIPVEGTPLANAEPIDNMELIRTIAVARILMPQSKVRLSAGRENLNQEAQILAFYAGANSIFLGEKLLTRANPTPDEDHQMLASLAGKSSPRLQSAQSAH